MRGAAARRPRRYGQRRDARQDAGPDLIVARGGNDIVLAFGGADLVCGGLGDDWILTGGGNDLVAGDDLTFFGNLDAVAGDDGNVLGPGDDAAFGQGGDDFLALAQGNDVGHGGGGADFLAGGPGNDWVLGQGGDDVMFGGVPPIELPPGTEPPPVPPSGSGVCAGDGGCDTAVDCDFIPGVESTDPPAPPRPAA